jgi:hypothetical protein
MNYLKAVLYGTYVVLIMLLLLTSVKWCTDETSPTDRIAVQPPHIDSLPNRPTPSRPVVDEAARLAERIGGHGDLKVTLLWNFYADIDLHVKQPNGRTIYFGASRDHATGGYLDVDNTRGGAGSAENIYWANNPPSGKYSVSLHYFAGSGHGVCKVRIFWKGELIESRDVNMSQVKQKRFITNIQVQ